jgi:hypothetical protein
MAYISLFITDVELYGSTFFYDLNFIMNIIHIIQKGNYFSRNGWSSSTPRLLLIYFCLFLPLNSVVAHYLNDLNFIANIIHSIQEGNYFKMN